MEPDLRRRSGVDRFAVWIPHVYYPPPPLSITGHHRSASGFSVYHLSDIPLIGVNFGAARARAPIIEKRPCIYHFLPPFPPNILVRPPNIFDKSTPVIPLNMEVSSLQELVPWVIRSFALPLSITVSNDDRIRTLRITGRLLQVPTIDLWATLWRSAARPPSTKDNNEYWLTLMSRSDDFSSLWAVDRVRTRSNNNVIQLHCQFHFSKLASVLFNQF